MIRKAIYLRESERLATCLTCDETLRRRKDRVRRILDRFLPSRFQLFS